MVTIATSLEFNPLTSISIDSPAATVGLFITSALPFFPPSIASVAESFSEWIVVYFQLGYLKQLKNNEQILASAISLPSVQLKWMHNHVHVAVCY